MIQKNKLVIFCGVLVVLFGVNYIVASRNISQLGFISQLGQVIKSLSLSQKLKEQSPELQVVFKGTLNILQIDDLSNSLGKNEDDLNKNSSRYFIFDGKERVEFISDTPVSEAPGDTVSVTGSRKGNSIYGTITKSEKKSDDKDVPESIVLHPKHKLAVLLVEFDDSPLEPFSSTELKSLITEGSFNKFYIEQSYGNIDFNDTDVYGWIKLPRHSNISGGCFSTFGNTSTFGWGVSSTELDPYITDNGIALNKYDHVALLFNCESGANIPQGWATVGKWQYLYGTTNTPAETSIMWLTSSALHPFLGDSEWTTWTSGAPHSFQWTNLDNLLSHEMGHNLGLLHANAYACGFEIYSANCLHEEYGNIFDVMGSGQGFGYHMNAFFKEQLGWINSGNSMTITKTGTYTINNIETTAGIKMAKIKVKGSEKYPYYLEYRKSIGFDQGLNYPLASSNQKGLFINYVNGDPHNNSLSSPHLLDAQPNSSLAIPNNPSYDYDFTQASLNGTSVFSDPESGIAVGPIVGTPTSNSITFKVSVVPPPPCISMPLTIKPVLGLVLSAISIPPGSDSGLASIIHNNDSILCPSTTAHINIVPPSGWPPATWGPSEYSFALAPGQDKEFSVNITVPLNTLPGIYNYIIKMDNNGVHSTKIFPIKVL